MIDFSKAFDVVVLMKLIIKLVSLDICYATLQKLQAFLLGRSLSIKINNHLSISSPVTSDIIHGSVLGPC